MNDLVFPHIDAPKPGEAAHEYSPEEAERRFIKHVRSILGYWRDLPDKTAEERLEGLAFSILAAIDGSALTLPGFILAPCPHEDDEAYHKSRGECWYPRTDPETVKCNISGALHEHFLQWRGK